MRTDLYVAWLEKLMRAKFDAKMFQYGIDEHREWVKKFEGGGYSTEYLLNRLAEEVGELMEAYRLWKYHGHDESEHHILEEAADVGNFAALIAYQHRKAAE